MPVVPALHQTYAGLVTLDIVEGDFLNVPGLQLKALPCSWVKNTSVLACYLNIT